MDLSKITVIPNDNEKLDSFLIKNIEMARYYVNKNAQVNGDHEVHKLECSWIPKVENRIYLGEFDNCKDAVKEAKKYYNKVNGCYYCSKECHTS